MLRVLLAICLGLVLVLGLEPHPAYACECPPQPDPQTAMRDSTTVFVGRAVEVLQPARQLTFSRQPPFVSYEIASHAPSRTRFTVARVYHGPADATIEITSGRFAMVCGMQFQQGSDYLVYGIRTGAGDLMTHRCTRTRLVDRAAPDLRVFDAGVVPQPAPAAVSWLWLLLAVPVLAILFRRFAKKGKV